MEDVEGGQQQGGSSRRGLLKKAGAAAAVAWAAPIVMSAATPASASVASKKCLALSRETGIACGTCTGANPTQPECGPGCHCYTDLTGCCFCGTDVTCNQRACNKHADCPAGWRCIPASCCGAPQGFRGMCIPPCGTPGAAPVGARTDGRTSASL